MTSHNPQEGGKHTPGPWQMSRHGNLVGSNGATVVVWGSGLTNVHRGPESEANARLISAAPALLEALSFLANEVDAMRAFEDGVRQVIGHTNWSVLDVRLKEARAAVLQATGGENGR